MQISDVILLQLHEHNSVIRKENYGGGNYLSLLVASIYFSLLYFAVMHVKVLFSS